MKTLLIYLSLSVLLLAIATPAPAQTSQADQYGGPGEDPCAGLSGSELNQCLIESYPEGSEYNSTIADPCAGLSSPELEACLAGGTGQYGDPRYVVPQANKSSNRAFRGVSNALSKVRSGGQNKAEAEEFGANKPSSQIETNKHPSPVESGGPDGSAVVATAADKTTRSSKSGGEKETEVKRSAQKGADAGQKAGNDSRSTATKPSDGAASSGTTALPETSGFPVMLVGAGVLLLAGGITATRLFR